MTFNIFSNPKKTRYDPDLARRINEEKDIPERKVQKPIPAKQPQIQKAPDLKGSIYVPSINLHISKDKFYHGKSWNECHQELANEGAFMPTIKHFVEFIKYLKTDYQDKTEADRILDEILTVRSPWRGEWLDAKFEKRKNGLYLLSDHKIENGKLKSNYEQPLEQCLMEYKQIDLENYLKTANSQGLPSPKTKSGKLYYWAPADGIVAGFNADSGRAYLDCNYNDPDGSYDSLGVRKATAGGGSRQI